jgi:LPXTG-motif cell wall-anchored protein
MVRNNDKENNTMNLKATLRRVSPGLAAATVCVALGVSTNAQVQTRTTPTAGQAETRATVDRATVVSVDGNDLIVKMDDGTIRHFPDVPESARATVNGEQLGIHDLKPGMRLERTITATTTPMTITTVQTVTGKVWHVSPPSTVILTLQDGTNQSFKIPKGQQFNISGKMMDAWGLRKGMQVTASKVVESTETQIANQRRITGTMPPPPPPPPADAPILIAKSEPVAPPAAASPEEAPALPAQLPKTGSSLPLVGLLGMLSMLAGLGLRAARPRA